MAVPASHYALFKKDCLSAEELNKHKKIIEA